MPKINVYSVAEEGRRVEVGWHPNGSVQIGTTLRNPVKLDSAGTATTASASTKPYADVSADGGWRWEGQFADLDRHGINNLIRALREARDKAYGRDE